MIEKLGPHIGVDKSKYVTVQKIDELIDAHNNLEKRVERLEYSMEVHQPPVEPHDEPTVEQWKPKLKERYFFVTDNGMTGLDYYHPHSESGERVEFGNCFPTVQTAIQAAARIRTALKGDK